MRPFALISATKNHSVMQTIPSSFPSLFSKSCFAIAAAATTLIGWSVTLPALAKQATLQVGIVQRFGDEPQDKMTISSAEGDLLRLRLINDNGQPQTISAKQITLQIGPQALPATQLAERVVLSDHATFETAEDSALQWQAQGLAVEIAQPERWEVWAKRSAYNSPLVRRWLLQSLREQGFDQPYLSSRLLNQQPRVFFTLNGNRFIPNTLEIRSNTSPIRVIEGKTNRRYGGNLKLQPNAYGTYTLVNTVPIETYLRGVIPHEIGSKAPFNAAKAQTIIARTYALRNVRRFQADGYQLSADTHCQVYYGLTGTTATADKAIAQTNGLVLTYQNELVDALYSSTTGGVTARFSDVWNGAERPYLLSVIDSPNNIWDLSQQSLENEGAFRKFISLTNGFNEAGRSVFRWNRQGTLEQLSQDLKKYLQRRKHPMTNFGKIQKMRITKRSPSGRVLTLKISTDQGLIELHKNEIRSALGPPRSTLFYLDPIVDPNTQQLKGYAFVGGGLGHGVGLSQYGSYNLARLGWSAEQILAFYYPGTTIQPLSQSIVLWRDQSPSNVSQR